MKLLIRDIVVGTRIKHKYDTRPMTIAAVDQRSAYRFYIDVLYRDGSVEGWGIRPDNRHEFTKLPPPPNLPEGEVEYD